MILELLALAGLFGATQAIAHNGGDSDDSDDDNTDVDISKYLNDLYKPGNHFSHTRYWENSETGDYIKHKIDIDIK